MGLFNDNSQNDHLGHVKVSAGKQGPPGTDGIGFKLTADGNYDLEKKFIRNVKCPPDVAHDDDYDSYVEDLNSGVNKEYVNDYFLKKDKNDNYNLNQGIIKNCEPYYDGLFDDHSLVSKEYVDRQDSKQDIAINSNSQLLANRADLTKRTPQTFAGRIQVPNFRNNDHNLADVPNLRYVIGNFLNKNTGGVLNKSIQFDSSNSNDDRQLFGLGTPKYNTSAASKQYVDNAVASSGSGDSSKFFYTDGSKPMTGNLNLNRNKVMNSSDPISDQDLVTKKYMETHSSSNRSNAFKYVMDNPEAERTEEDDVELGNVVTVQSSPHMINKNAIDTKLIFDSGKAYYSSRIGINLYSLANSDYTMVFELIWTDTNVNPDIASLNAISSIETIYMVSEKVFDNYDRLVVQFNKSQNIGNNYLYIDISIRMKSGASYPAKLQTYILCYGVKGLESDIPLSVYDAFWTVDDGKIVMNETIDMGNKPIIGIKDGADPSGAVNFQQLTSMYAALETSLKKLISQKETRSYYIAIKSTSACT